MLHNNNFYYLCNSEILLKNDGERISALLKLYKEMLNFLTLKGACLLHVFPEYLLNYHDYTMYIDLKNSQFLNSMSAQYSEVHIHEKISKQMFQNRSKQCWLDVILQTFKSLVLYQINEKSLNESINTTADLRCSIISSNMTNFHSFTSLSMQNIMNRVKIHKNRHESEAILLAWLEYHYEQQCNEEWMNINFSDHYSNEKQRKSIRRTVENFDCSLVDGIILITITAAYCPFLINTFFSNIYVYPETYEEKMHNAICIVRAWMKIRLGFIITPKEIVHPNCVQMLMLVAHLFKILPSYFPKIKIHFSCSLTNTINRRINLTNTENYPVHYIIQFFGNEARLFSVKRNILRINPKTTAHVEINFHARKIIETKAYLIFCCSAVGYNFAKNQTFILEGRCDELIIYDNYTIISKLYIVHDKTLAIKVPYELSAEYEIWITTEQPTKPSTLKSSQWSDLRSKKVLRRLYLNQKTMTVLENAKIGNLMLTIACITPNPQSYWIIFKANFGDFIIQINLKCQTSITNCLSIAWNNKKCICPNTLRNSRNLCPLNIKIIIPSKNIQLWKCFNEMFKKVLNSKELLFWSHYLETNIGLRLIHWFMKDHNDVMINELVHLFNVSVTYKVHVKDKTDFLRVSDVLTIPDVHSSNKETEITVHISEKCPEKYKTIISLTSMDGNEIRIYKIDFNCKNSSTILSISKDVERENNSEE